METLKEKAVPVRVDLDELELISQCLATCAINGDMSKGEAEKATTLSRQFHDIFEMNQ